MATTESHEEPKAKRASRPPKRLLTVARLTLRQAEDVRRRMQQKLNAEGPDWIPDDGWLDKFNTVSGNIVRLIKSVADMEDRERDINRELGDADLEAAVLDEVRHQVMTMPEATLLKVLRERFGDGVSLRRALPEATEDAPAEPTVTGIGPWIPAEADDDLCETCGHGPCECPALPAPDWYTEDGGAG